MPEQSATDRIYTNFLQDFPVELRPFARSLIVSRIAAHQEKPHDSKVEKTWMVNSDFLEQEINNEDKKAVLGRAVCLTTLPKHPDKKSEWYYRWLRGNGITILQDERMNKTLNTFMDDQEKSKSLTDALTSFLATDVTGLDKGALSDVPEGYSLFVTFLVCDSLTRGKPAKNKTSLINLAEKRLLGESEVNRVMDIFGVITDTKPLYERFNAYRSRIELSHVKA